jgi:serine/threonine protein phosphatase PrpC
MRNRKWQHFFSICDGHGTFGHDVSGYLKYVFPLLYLENCDRLEADPRCVLNEIYEIANEKLNFESGIDLLFSGSTVSSVYFHKNSVFCANIGDSRAAIGKRST